MAPKKKSKTAPTPKQGGKTAPTPKDAHFARLNEAIDKCKAKGSMLVLGIRSENSDEDEDEDEDDSVVYSAEQMATLRHILITSRRDKAIREGHSFASCGQSDEDFGFCSFSTSSGNEVVFGIPAQVKKAMKKKSPAEQFDSLFGLTHGLKSFDSWMHDNECWEPGGELEAAITTLAKAWRSTLKRNDAELEIDTEFTRPGIESLLEQLEEDFSTCDAAGDFPFKWRA
jgi:hypothetical protein